MHHLTTFFYLGLVHTVAPVEYFIAGYAPNVQIGQCFGVTQDAWDAWVKVLHLFDPSVLRFPHGGLICS